jgi:hypothetical protein
MVFTIPYNVNKQKMFANFSTARIFILFLCCVMEPKFRPVGNTMKWLRAPTSQPLIILSSLSLILSCKKL